MLTSCSFHPTTTLASGELRGGKKNTKNYHATAVTNGGGIACIEVFSDAGWWLILHHEDNDNVNDDNVNDNDIDNDGDNRLMMAILFILFFNHNYNATKR